MKKQIFDYHKNLVKLLIIGVVAFIVCFFIARFIGNKSPKMDETKMFQAREVYQQKISSTNKSAYDLVVAGARLINSNEYEMARIALEQAVKKDAGYRDGWLYLGITYLKQNDAGNATKALEQAKDKDPIYALTYKYLALAYEKAGNVDLSKECYNKFIQLSK